MRPFEALPVGTKAALRYVAFALCMFLVPAASHAASVGVGASVWCAWWSSIAEMRSTVLGGSSKTNQEPFAAGGPFVVAQINNTWGLSFSYLYGKLEWETAALILGTRATDQRHDLDVSVTASVHKYVKLFFGAKYWGHLSDMTTNVLFISYKSSLARHTGGPGFGLNLPLPLGAGFYLQPSLSFVLMFGKITPPAGGFLGQIIAPILSAAGTESTAMYYGLNSSLALLYNIEKINLTLSIGGRFQYLWLYFIEAERQMDDGDMFGGITFSVMYQFNI
jgi:hypothetical protein